ncbi:MAG: hypothetical protein ACMG6H_08445 [Acidobacteriota bacterium]
MLGLFLLVVVVALAGLFIFVRYNLQVRGPEADERLKTLEKEFSLIAPLSDASRLRYESSHKVSLGGVGADYRTDKTYAQIRGHYDNELKKNGWRFVGEEPVTIWWHDYGGKEVSYCKDHNTATLEYSGEWEEAGWTYSFNMSWGLSDGCK